VIGYQLVANHLQQNAVSEVWNALVSRFP
jgi:hypothetical protein